MIKVHTVILTDGSRDYPYLISGCKTNAKGKPAPYSKADARKMAIQKLWETEFAPYTHKRIGGVSVLQLSVASDEYRWALLEKSFSVKAHIVKSIKEGDISTSTKRNADGSKKRHRSTTPKATTPKATTPKATTPKAIKEAAIDALANGVISAEELENFLLSRAASRAA